MPIELIICTQPRFSAIDQRPSNILVVASSGLIQLRIADVPRHEQQLDGSSRFQPHSAARISGPVQKGKRDSTTGFHDDSQWQHGLPMLCCDNPDLVLSEWNIWELEIMRSRFSAFPLLSLSSKIIRVATLIVDHFPGFSTVVTSLSLPTNRTMRGLLDFRATRYTKLRKSFGLRSLLTILYGYKNHSGPHLNIRRIFSYSVYSKFAPFL